MSLALPPWAIVSERRRAHIARVTALVEQWAEAMGVPTAEGDRWRTAAALHDAQMAFVHEPAPLTQEHIDAAVTKSLETVPLPSQATRAWEAVQGSVVRVRAFHDGPDGGETQSGVGTGVVILDKGVILTNIHVVAGADRIGITFADGMEASAVVTGTRPEDDLAVLQATTVPDDLKAATLQSTSGLAPGDHVTAVGFPFGIGSDFRREDITGDGLRGQGEMQGNRV